jgi:hypothetical protein
LLVYGDWDVPGTKFNFVLVRTAKKFKARDLRKAIQALVNSFDPTLKPRRNARWLWQGEEVTPPWDRSIWDAFKELRYVWDGVELKRYVEPQPDSNVEVVNAGTDHKA